MLAIPDSHPFAGDPERRELLHAEAAASSFISIAGSVSTSTPSWTFRVVRERDVKAHGEHRMKRWPLKIYDELAEAIPTRRPHRTRLNPPLGDPRVGRSPQPETASVEAEADGIEQLGPGTA